MSDLIDVAVVGAGPYGLSIAAHLRHTGMTTRVFGLPMHLWRASMPAGMFLKSQGFASNISAPGGAHTLRAFCRSTERDYGDYGVPVPLETFAAYGRDFQRTLVSDLEEVLVTDVARLDGNGNGDGTYELRLADGRRPRARNVVIASGVEHFADVPEPLSALPGHLCSHSSAHSDLGALRGRDVIVVGAGQSALESAALLHESEASVRVVARAGQLTWNGPPLSPDRPLARRIREPEAALGSGWATWFYTNHPNVYRRLPADERVRRARTALGPAGACWLRSRIDGRFPVLLGHTLIGAEPEPSGDRVRLRVRAADGERVLTADHVIAATGYRAELSRLHFVGSPLREKVRTVGGAPWVGRDFQSSVAGLFFVGPAVAATFGPVMRFVHGTHFAASTVSRHLASAGRAGGGGRAGAAAPKTAPARGVLR